MVSLPNTGKLVRDRIPDLIRESGGNPQVLALDVQQYRDALRLKVVEEATELAQASDEESISEEIADVLQVLLAVANSHGIPWQQVESLRLHKQTDRGGFDEQTWLVATPD